MTHAKLAHAIVYGVTARNGEYGSAEKLNLIMEAARTSRVPFSAVATAIAEHWYIAERRAAQCDRVFPETFRAVTSRLCVPRDEATATASTYLRSQVPA